MHEKNGKKIQLNMEVKIQFEDGGGLVGVQ